MVIAAETIQRGPKIELKTNSELYLQYKLYRSILGSEESLLSMAVLAKAQQPLSMPDVSRLVFAMGFMPLSQALIIHQKGNLREALLANGVTDEQVANTAKRLKGSYQNQWESLGLVTVTHQAGVRKGALVLPDLLLMNQSQTEFVQRLTQNVITAIGNPNNHFAASLVDIFGQRTTEGATNANMVDWVILQIASASNSPITIAQIIEMIEPSLNPKFVRERCQILVDKGIISYRGYEAHQDNILYGVLANSEPLPTNSILTNHVFAFLKRHPNQQFTVSEIIAQVKKYIPDLSERTVEALLKRGVGKYFTRDGEKEAQLFLSDMQQYALRALFTAISAHQFPLENPLESPIVVALVLSNMKEKEISWEERKQQILNALSHNPRATARQLAVVCGISEGGMTKYLTVLEQEAYVDHIEVNDTFRWRVLSEKQRRIELNKFLAEERLRKRYEKQQEQARRILKRDHERRKKIAVKETREKLRNITVVSAVQEYNKIEHNYPSLTQEQDALLYHYLELAQLNPAQHNELYVAFWKQLKALPDYSTSEDMQRRMIALDEDCRPDLFEVLFFTKLHFVKKYVQSWKARNNAAASFEELMQTASLVLSQAIDAFESRIQFEENLIPLLDEALGQTRHNNAALGLTLSLPAFPNDPSSETLAESVASPTDQPSHGLLLSIVEENMSVCSVTEQTVIILILEGLNVLQITQRLGLQEVEVENLIVSAGVKLREVID
ncbi:MAG TPA: winged helix-turn-helix transcriptional regulator [Patescibacteria group bacterium]